MVVCRSPAQVVTARGNAHYGLLVGQKLRPARIPFTGTFSLASCEADARGLDEHLAYGGVCCNEKPNRGPVAVVRIDRLQRRSAVDLLSRGAAAHNGEALALLEGVDQTCIRQSTVGGHPDRLLEDGHPYIIAEVVG